MVARTTAALKKYLSRFLKFPKKLSVSGSFLLFYRVFGLPEWHVAGLFQSAVERAMLKHRSSTN
jgi:hypothetical protein